MRTFADLRLQVLRSLDEAGDTGTTRALASDYLNQAHEQRLTQYDWNFMLWPDPQTIQLVDDIRVYSLHQEFLRPLYVYNRSRKHYMIEVPTRSLVASGARWNEDRQGREFALWERQPVASQPSAASVITIVSSSASDTGSTKAILVRGETANGVTTESITPQGTTPVAGLLQFTKILGITKSSAWVGTLTVTSNAGAVTNLTLFSSEYGRSYQTIRLLYPPEADLLEYSFYRKPLLLSNDNDIPEIPPPFAEILVWDALMLLSAYDGRLDPGRVAIWKDNQNRLERQMIQTLTDGQSLEAMPRYVRVMDQDYPTR